jgi:glycosyltransferase involved in cell wall biosynthesis
LSKVCIWKVTFLIMKHLIICREYPPAPSGGIGTYALHISQLLAESGEAVHVIGQLWKGAEKRVEEKCHGRLIIHRVPVESWTSIMGPKPSPAITSKTVRGLFESNFYPQCFSWQASLLAESLIEQEGIDVIEAQEYEAPLYYLQLRRALGLGPKIHPPCVIHLHSPTEFIAHYNDWDMGLPAVLTAKRLENYSIAAADALLCPSRYLARQAEAHYGLTEGSIGVIPLPIGNSPMLERNPETWKQGTICYVGRLEPRKGVIEWVDAAVAVADEYQNAQFEFVGANCSYTNIVTVQEFVERRIPRHLRARFHFRGEQKRFSLPQFLARARIAVVPSRWENFPYTCIEAMGSGLPVIASREGGMVEMIVDGQTGWLARQAGSEGLTAALKRALETPAMEIAKMGYQAASDIRRTCDNQKILESHLNFRSQLAGQRSIRSLHLPVNLPWANRPLSDESARRISQNSSPKGLAIVVTCNNAGQFLNGCLQSLEQQTQKPLAVVIVNNGTTEKQTLKMMKQVLPRDWPIIHPKNGGIALAKNAGIETVLNSGLNPLGFAFLNAEDRLQPHFVARCESVLQQCPEVGLVSCWTHHSKSDNRVWIKPCPSFPYQWLSNEAAPFSVVRTEALQEAGNFRNLSSQGYEDWDLFNAVMAAGWGAVTIPEILGDHRNREDSMVELASPHTPGRMYKELLERFPELIARDAQDIALLAGSRTTRLLNEETFTVSQQLEMVRLMLRYPRQTTRTALWVLDQVKRKLSQHPAFQKVSVVSRTIHAVVR